MNSTRNAGRASRRLLMAAVMAALLPLVAPAQPESAQTPSWRRSGGMMGLTGALDRNQDRIISSDEIATATQSLLKLDKNHDGRLTADEYGFGRMAEIAAQRRQNTGQPDSQTSPGPRTFTPPVVAALDADRDGTLSAAELENAPAALRTLDKNDDGRLTREELWFGRGERPTGTSTPAQDQNSARPPRPRPQDAP